MDSAKTAREHWGSKLGFIAATAGSAIGLGSLWKFPYATGMNGGGIFIFAYLIFTFFIGIPLFIGELLIGRGSQKSPVGALEHFAPEKPHWRAVGWLLVLVNFLILSYYSVVAGWATNYALMSLSNYTHGLSASAISSLFDTMYKAPGINLFWFFIFMLMTLGVVIGGVRKGIEQWTKILTPTLLLILLGLTCYSITLPGASQAFDFIFTPRFEKLSPSGILEALGLSFYTLSLGMGIILTYGSYMKRDGDIPRTALTIGAIDVVTSLTAALMIFPIIFTFGLQPQEGPGLLFKVMPVLFEQLPATMLLSTAFFILVVFTALTSTVSILEVQVATFMENFGWTRKKAVCILAAAVFLFGIPSALAGSGAIFADWAQLFGRNFFDTLDYLCSVWILPINGMLLAIFAGWRLHKKFQYSEFTQGSAWKFLFKPWLFLIRWVVPLAILIVVLQQAGLINIDQIF